MKRLGRSQTLVFTLKGGSGKPLEDFKKGRDIIRLSDSFKKSLPLQEIRAGQIEWRETREGRGSCPGER